MEQFCPDCGAVLTEQDWMSVFDNGTCKTCEIQMFKDMAEIEALEKQKI